jgi:hypothetical protein
MREVSSRSLMDASRNSTLSWLIASTVSPASRNSSRARR